MSDNRPNMLGICSWSIALKDMEKHPKARYRLASDKAEVEHRMRGGVLMFSAKVNWQPCGVRYVLEAPDNWWKRLPDAKR